ncbi:MAG: T9SS type A sorting domain-containing protein [Bacteroidales bacterium]|nr:T9SS type A sorting domain-containing protein [Bacteroidales bacterium]
MRTLLTLLTLFLALVSIQAQELIRNGDFESNDGSSAITALDYWHIDKEAPGSGVGGSDGDYHVYLAGDDSTIVYQVIDVVSSDSMIYDVSLEAENTWEATDLLIIACTSDADTSVREEYFVDTIPFTTDYLPNVMTSFAFAPASEYAGKKLIIGFQIIPAGGWVNIDDVSVIKKLPGENTKPICYAGDEQRVVGGSTVTLDGSGCSDPDGDELTYTWVSQFPGIILSDAHAQSPTFTAPDVTEISVYNFSLVVNDGIVDSETSYTTVTVVPAGELIRNGDFTERNEGWEETNNLKEILYWNMDVLAEEVTGGIWDLTMIHLTTTDPNLYQVVDEVGADTAIYTLTFTAKTSWYCENMNSVFSVSGADTSDRTEISEQNNPLEWDSGTETGGDFVVYQHIFTIPAGSAHVGKKLMVEFGPTLIDNEAEVVEGWAQLQTVSLVKQVITTDATESPEASKLSIYPNPGKDYIRITAEMPVNEVAIYNASGSLLKSVRGQQLNGINIQDLEPGMYVISVITDSKTITKKLIIN